MNEEQNNNEAAAALKTGPDYLPIEGAQSTENEALQPPNNDQWQKAIGGKCFCHKCKRTLAAEKKFYTNRDHMKPLLCKECLTMHVDNTKPETFIWILKMFDVPFVQAQWNNVFRLAIARNPANIGGPAVLGRYLSKMKLNPWNRYRFKDSEELEQQELEKISNSNAVVIGSDEDVAIYDSQVAALKEQLESGVITEAQYQTLLPNKIVTKEEIEQKAQEQNEQTQEHIKTAVEASFKPTTSEEIYQQTGNFFDEAQYINPDELPDPTESLTQDDKIYLAMKWGRQYSMMEWIELEKTYRKMTKSFEITDADSINNLIFICKTYLKMNQAIDSGDIDGYKKLSAVYESLRKSTKLTAAQNKEGKTDVVDSVGQLVAFCEKEAGHIPRYEIEVSQDKIDIMLKDMQKYVYNLVTQDLGFGNQIEIYLKKIEMEKEAEHDSDLDMSYLDPEKQPIENEDIADYYSGIEEQLLQDEEAVNQALAETALFDDEEENELPPEDIDEDEEEDDE